MTKFDPNQYLEVFLQGNVLKIINFFLEKSLEFLYFQKMAMIPAFFDQNMPRNLGFHDKKNELNFSANFQFKFTQKLN